MRIKISDNSVTINMSHDQFAQIAHALGKQPVEISDGDRAYLIAPERHLAIQHFLDLYFQNKYLLSIRKQTKSEIGE